MTPLAIYASSLGATIRPHPATEPVPGDGGVVVVTPGATWQCVDDMSGGQRTDMSTVVLVAPDLQRGGFMPTVIATTSIITPAVPAAGLFEAVEMSMQGAEAWQVRARSITGDDDNNEDRTLDLLAGFRADGLELALSSLVRARRSGGVTVFHQVHVTTLADQIPEHAAGLAAARID